MVPIGHRHHHQGPVAEEDSISIPMGSLKKGPWSAAEDKILMEYVREHGEGNWNAVQRNTSLQRCGKSCRLRWANHLRPNLKKGAFSHEEERLIIDLHSKLGNKWARISAHLPGRTDNEVKNYWNTRVKRRLRQGLPLYPNHNNQTAPSFSSILSPQQPPSPPPAPPLPTHLKTSPSGLSFLDPTSLPFPPPFFSFNNPSFLSPSPALSTRVSLSGPSLVPFGSNSLQNFQTRVQSDPLSLGFEYKLELPSNQLRPKSAYDDDQTVYSYQANDAAAKFNPNIGERDNSGLLDALLPEAQSRAATTAGEMLNKDNLDGHQWGSIYDISSTGVNYTDGDLSSVIGVVASPKVSGGQSSSISDENPEPEFPEVSLNPEWLDSSESYTSWDNLPRIF